MPNEYCKFARNFVMELEPNFPYTTAEDIKAKHGLKDIVILDSNENPLGTSPKAVQAIKDAAHTCGRYPDNTSSVLRRKVADANGIEPDMVLFGNGADNVLLMLSEAFLNPGDEMLVGSPYFFVYYTTSQLCGAKVEEVPLNEDYAYDLDAVLAKIGPRTKIVMICNPNNPTGTIVDEAAVKRFMDAVPDHCIVVFDEAYGEFARALTPDFPNTVPYIKAGRNVLIIRTLSKTYGLAGSRIGYVMGPYGLIEILMRVQEPFTVNILAQAAGAAALDDQEFLQKTIDLTNEGREYLNKELTALGFHCLPSYTNFLFVDMKQESKPIQQALEAKGYLIRVGGGWNRPTCARITIGTMEQNRGLIQALKEVL